MSQLVHRTDVAVAVRVETSQLAELGGGGAALAVVQGTALVAWRCVCVGFQLGLMLIGAVLAFAGMVAELLGPALRSAGAAAIEASKGGCDCDRG